MPLLQKGGITLTRGEMLVFARPDSFTPHYAPAKLIQGCGPAPHRLRLVERDRMTALGPAEFDSKSRREHIAQSHDKRPRCEQERPFLEKYSGAGICGKEPKTHHSFEFLS
jgi:hypothetical protein